MVDAATVWGDIERIRAERPLVHNITNYVVMNLRPTPCWPWAPRRSWPTPPRRSRRWPAWPGPWSSISAR